MIVIADNDIIYKLALCDLLNEFLEWLKVPPSEIWVLPSLKYVIKKKLKENTSANLCFQQFLLKARVIPKSTIANLKLFDELDPGEQQLLAVFYEQTISCRLATGDKRAIKEIAKIAQQNPALLLKLQGKVECLESIMLGLIHMFGFDEINRKILSSIDGVFSMAFGRDQCHAIDALQSFLRELRNDAAFVVER